ncbi:phospholipid/cholesterol/gamma-HCH transport system ATP-binding protein [Halopolyspora algeriensis]|uniref:Phospholipid/cholesterol/gamma-HCH transport system ATP-binding protein n=1 Tax=Halopolyspora algeriensis TaxID=1500506 RepID=A0A368VX67_9ACTN|nr:ABC transporter ATP-binding protein [Halopolyspora algeriensis]RCW46796.1 phospholipid/cholesterol/gamma-HCH transport system ATP-binding protein [Halopolyspora algeriensis]TQM39214.1 phospholipid/cholesterol/gamma-HCH transport system ATP-binding protein [Halopolyspora algeriensis]
MGVEVAVEGLSKSFGAQTIWSDVTLTLPRGEISVLLGPSGTGKSVFLKSLVGLLTPEHGRVVINGVDVCSCSERELYEIRKLFGVLFQDGALFGSMNLYDNIAFPLREHTRSSETEVRNVVLEKMEMVGLIGAETKLPGEISGGMKKRAGLARALVLDPEIILFDEPDSGLDPVRTAYLNQLIVDLNAQTDATFLIVTHDINTARTVPDNIGMLFRRHLAMFGPREVLLTSTEPAVEQFLNGRRQGPIGMSEEKDSGQAAAELAELDDDKGVPEIIPQLEISPGVPRRAAIQRRQDRVMANLQSLDADARQEVLRSLGPRERERYGVSAGDDPVLAEVGQPADESPEKATVQRTESMHGSLSAEQVASLPTDSGQQEHPTEPRPDSPRVGGQRPDEVKPTPAPRREAQSIPEQQSQEDRGSAGARQPGGAHRRSWFGRKSNRGGDQ